MKRLLPTGWLLPLGLAVAGIALIIAGRLQGEEIGQTNGSASPTPSLAATAAPDATGTPTLRPSRTASPANSAPATATPVPTPTPSPTLAPDVVADRLEIPAVGIAVAVRQATDPAVCGFPPADAAYVLCDGAQPGRGTNSYIFAHALPTLFKPLWNVQLGNEVLVTMTDGSVRRYLITEVRPNVPCPDPNPPDPALNPPPGEMPLVLQYAAPNCDEGVRWTVGTASERLTLQTSQGYNRNWGEFVVIAEPAEG